MPTATANFERPFTPRTSLRSPRNFGNARFRRFATFDFSTLKKKIGNIFGSKNQIFVQFDLNFTSMSTSILRPCRPQFYVHFDLNFFRKRANWQKSQLGRTAITDLLLAIRPCNTCEYLFGISKSESKGGLSDSLFQSTSFIHDRRLSVICSYK